MLSEDEKKLLKIFKAQVEKEETEYFSVNAYTQLLYDSHKTVLNLITKLQKENKEKDEQIDLMAEYTFNNNKAELIIEYGIEDKEQFIEKFEKLAKEKGE